MGQFKPMVKMETTEPSVILKLKKGGSAHKKMKGDAKTGHKMMDGGMAPSALNSMAPKIAPRSSAPVARVPARPSFASRRRAMMPKVSVPPMKKGGKACYADGGSVKGIINTENQGGEYRNTKMHSAENTTKTSGKTGDVKKGNGGGYKTGGVVLGNGGGYKTGGVALSNAGGYKKGGSSKKAYASGGSVNDEGKATSMPQGAKKPSSPVAINMLSGTFKKGGDVSSKKLQATFKKENAPAVSASKAKLLDKYSPYQKKSGGEVESKAQHASEMRRIGNVEKALASHKAMKASKGHKGLADGGVVSDSAYQAVKEAEKAGKPTMINKPLKATPKAEKKYPSGLTDTDIDKILGSSEMQEKLTHNIDKKHGGKVKK